MSNTQEALIARRYAKALIELAEEHKKLDVISRDMDSLRGVYTNAELIAALKSPQISRQNKSAIVQALAKKMKLDNISTKFLGVLAQNGRIALLSAVVDTTLSQIAVRRGEVTAEVVSARKLNATHVKELKASLKKMTGADIDVVLKEDETIIGGLVIKVGSLMIDQSVKTRLDRLKRALKSNNTQNETKELRNAA